MQDALNRYHQSLRDLEATRGQLSASDARWNFIRVSLFFATVVSFALGTLSEPVAFLTFVGWGLLFAFLVAVSLHQRLRDQMDELRNSSAVLKRLIARLERNWERLPLWKPDASILVDDNRMASSKEAISDDLDVFGKGSLFQFVSMASTGPGLRTLASWVSGPALAETAKRRSESIEAIAPMAELRERLYNLARRAAHGTSDPDQFLAWINRPSWLSRNRALAIWSVLTPVFAVAIIVGIFVFPGIARNAAIALGVLIGINALISTFLLGEVHQIFASAISGRGDVEGYRELFEMTADLPSETPMLEKIRDVLSGKTNGAAAAMESLGWIAFATSIKHVALLFPLYLLLQMLGMWELHVLRLLEKWQMRHQSQAVNWFAELGKLEAIGSLAALSAEYPDWARPVWKHHNDSVLDAKQIGHPLISDEIRVCNDVTIGPSGTLLLVTGSNMSGKSTMLRSIGLNVLLAGCGARVCSNQMSLPSTELATSIRVRDNLGEGVSFYMAELKSLARVVRHAESVSKRRHTTTDSPTLLFLLDEILQGTNSRERQIAVAHVLRHLIDCRAIGAITTHDLELADDPQLKAIAHTVHFRETITQSPDGSDTMTFDYQMHEGVSPTTNALRLLELVGLGRPDAKRQDL